MNFLIDANLPRRLVRIFQERGHDAVHTLDLPEGNATTDAVLLDYADENTAPLQPKILISVHPSGYKTVQANYCSFPRAT